MIFGGYAYGSSAFGSSSPSIPCPSTPSCNLVVMEILDRLRDSGIYIDQTFVTLRGIKWHGYQTILEEK